MEESEKQQAQQRHWKARRQFVAQPQSKAGAGHPVQQRWFLKPGLTPKPRRNPVARPRHLAANGGVTGLVRPYQPRTRQTKQVKKVEQDEK